MAQSLTLLTFTCDKPQFGSRQQSRLPSHNIQRFSSVPPHKSHHDAFGYVTTASSHILSNSPSQTSTYSTLQLYVLVTYRRGKRCRSWMRQCATSRKVAGSFPHGVIRIFHRQSHRTTQPLNRNEYQEYFLGFKGGRCLGLTLLPSCADFKLNKNCSRITIDHPGPARKLSTNPYDIYHC